MVGDASRGSMRSIQAGHRETNELLIGAAPRVKVDRRWHKHWRRSSLSDRRRVSSGSVYMGAWMGGRSKEREREMIGSRRGERKGRGEEAGSIARPLVDDGGRAQRRGDVRIDREAIRPRWGQEDRLRVKVGHVPVGAVHGQLGALEVVRSGSDDPNCDD